MAASGPGGALRRRTLTAGAAIAAMLAATLAAPAGAEPVPAGSGVDSGVLISEVGGAYGPGGTREDFVEIQNYSAGPVDITGWRIYRCIGTGDRSHPPQVVIPEHVLAPGERYTIARPADLSSIDPSVVDQTYATSMHPESFGVYLQDAHYGRVDSLAVFPEGALSACGTGADDVLPNDLIDVVGESYQRVAMQGPASTAFITALRTPGLANATQERSRAGGDVLISEIANIGPSGNVEGFVEIANYGTADADLSGWTVYQCGPNGRMGAGSALEVGTILPAGGTLTLSAARNPAVPDPDVIFAAALHVRMAGALILDEEQLTVDRVGLYNNRDSACADGTPAPATLAGFTAQSYQRIGATRDNAADFVQTERTPGELVEPTPSQGEPFVFGPIRVSEASPAGPGGVDDEFFELANYGDEPVDLTGWSVWSCAGDGSRITTPRVADIGAVLETGQVWVAAHVNAPAALRALAQATYTGALNQTGGYGLYVQDAEGELVDSLGVYFEDASRTANDRYSPCTKGYSAHNAYRFDEADSHSRVQATGVDGQDFQLVERTPGEFNTAVYDPGTGTAPGALDPVDVPTSHRPDMPETTGEAYTDPALTERAITVTAADPDGDLESVAVRAAAILDLAQDAISTVAGVTHGGPLAAAPGTDTSESAVADGPAGLAVGDDRYGYPYQRYVLDVSDLAGDLDVVWEGRSLERNELQLLAWDAVGGAWDLLDASQVGPDGAVTLHGALAGYAVDDVVHVAVQDGPRTAQTFDASVEPNLAFQDPGLYDFSISHISDPQMLAEYERQRYTDMFSWVVANADARNIAYSAITGDMIQNWLFGTQDRERAGREFQASSDILRLLEDAQIPHGVLPGNHDNLWGLDQSLFNSYFGPERYADQPWWGDSLTETDNSFHYDTFEAAGTQFLVVNLGFTQDDAGYAWAEQVIAEHPDHNVVIASHEYFNDEGERTTRDGERWTSRGQEIWEQLVQPYENVFLVLAGHHSGVVTHEVSVPRADGSTRTVVEMMANYQSFQTRDGNLANRYRDVAMQRLLQFDVASQQMAVNTYSATLDLFNAWSVDTYPYRGENARFTDADDEFITGVSIMYPKLVETTSLTATEPLQTLPAQTVPGEGGGLITTATLAGIAQGEGYAWIAEAVDATGAATRGPVTRFAGGLECTTTLTGSTPGRVVVESGVTCIADGATVRGPVMVTAGASLVAGSATLNGPVTADGAAHVHLRDTVIRGPVRITGSTVSSVLSGLTIDGPLTCTGNAASTDEGVPNEVSGPVRGECPGVGDR
ncbi:lamin tail domain-containing protein [Ruania sp. N2-46]|uniref:Lamin tail domain-containing protein n=2 Tax=Occultella gossypii TaxID=2800820 RepID=A0ABS7SHI4_9MICO|nr:lamin tail domain-containing protein [Occultella gossypii]